MKVIIKDEVTHKYLMSPNYNFVYDKVSGLFMRWGSTKEDDPSFSPVGPEILDLEISDGACSGNCKFCYKSNGGNQKSHHMTLDEFETILAKMPKTLCQVAFGITDVKSNPDFIEMMRHCRNEGVVPNYTCNGIDVDEDIAKQSAEVCGQVSVSYVNEDKTLEAIDTFSKAGVKSILMHYMLSEETFDNALSVVDKISTNDSVKAILFLQYKPKGKHPQAFTPIKSIDKYLQLSEQCKKGNVGHGMDSCSAPMFFKTIENDKNREMLTMLAEPCESTLFSSYINCYGKFYPCSFMEDETNWTEGIDVLNCDDFLRDVWYNERVNEWRHKLINSSQCSNCSMVQHCRSCPHYDITPCKEIV